MSYSSWSRQTVNPGLRKRKKLQTEKIGKARKGPLGGSGTKETEKTKKNTPTDSLQFP